MLFYYKNINILFCNILCRSISKIWKLMFFHQIIISVKGQLILTVLIFFFPCFIAVTYQIFLYHIYRLLFLKRVCFAIAPFHAVKFASITYRAYPVSFLSGCFHTGITKFSNFAAIIFDLSWINIINDNYFSLKT